MAKKKVDGGLLKIVIDNPIAALFDKLPKEVADAIEKTVKDTADLAFERIHTNTPRNRGTAAAGWTRTDKASSDGTAEATYTNDVPYINVLEYGGYPVKPKWHARPNATALGWLFGDALLGGYPPGPSTTQAPGGDPPMRSNVTTKAESGMVRETMRLIEQRYVFDLEEAIGKAFEGLAS